METEFLRHAWMPACLWAFLYAGDYYLTLYGARLAKRQPFVVIEGSYEMTPAYQHDIDNQRRLSSLLVAWLVGTTAFLLLIGYVAAPPVTWLYGVLAGMLILPELAVYLRHWRNITSYRRLASLTPGVSGQITYTRPFIYRQSALDVFGLAAFTSLAGVLTMSSVLLGGAFGLVLQALNHWRVSNTPISPKG
jgi:hypothetical protein